MPLASRPHPPATAGDVPRDPAPRPASDEGLSAPLSPPRPGAPPARRRGGPFAFLALGIALTALVTWRLSTAARRTDALRFETLALEVESRLRAVIGREMTALLGGAGLFALDDRVTAGDFHAFGTRLRAFGGLQRGERLGFARRLVRAPAESTAGESFPIAYLEPADGNAGATLGVDLAGEPALAKAMARARDTGEPAASGKVSSSGLAAGAAFFLFVPVYKGVAIPQTVADRRERLLGFVFSPVLTQELLEHVVTSPLSPELVLSLFDGPPDAAHRLFTSGAVAAAPALRIERSLPIAGHHFTMIVTSLPGFQAAWSETRLALVAATGLALSCLVFGFTRLQITARLAAEASAQRLREAREEALVHLQARDSFLSIASHELKTPLTALQLHVDGLLRGLPAAGHGGIDRERLARRLEAIGRQGRRLGALIDDLLDVSRVTAGQLKLHPEEVDLVPLVEEVRVRFEPELARAACTIQVDADGPVVGLWDRARVDQVLTNLLSNAIKYGPGKPIDVLVRRRTEGALLAVTDRGMGVDAKDHERIFERFERAVSERKFGGFGVGLWISRQIVAAMGGRISVVSAVGQGATFKVELPLRPPAAAPPSPPAPIS